MNQRQQPLVSIVLGTYNGERFLKEQLDSIMNQTYPNTEIIVTDDASTDGTKNILEEFAAKDNRIRVFFNDKNVGLLRNYEKAVQLTQGSVIAFADQDDVWAVNKIEKLLPHLDDFVLVYCNSEYIDANGKSMNRKLTDYRNPVQERNLFVWDEDSGIWIAGHALMFRRELLDMAFPFTPYIYHDAWISYVAMLKGKIKFISDVLVYYRQHGQNAVGGLGCHKMMTAKQVGNPKEDKAKHAVGRIDALLSILPPEETVFDAFLKKIKKYTLHPTFVNRVRRVCLRMRYANKIYAPRKRNILRKWFKALKSF